MGQSQPKPTTVNPVFVQQITKPRDFRALADQINRLRQETASSMGDIESMVGADTREIGALNAARRASTASAYLASIPRADKYLQATTGVTDPYAPARESAQSYLDYSKGLAQKAEQTAATYETPEFQPKHYSWEDIPAPGTGKKEKQRMADVASQYDWSGLSKQKQV